MWRSGGRLELAKRREGGCICTDAGRRRYVSLVAGHAEDSGGQAFRQSKVWVAGGRGKRTELIGRPAHVSGSQEYLQLEPRQVSHRTLPCLPAPVGRSGDRADGRAVLERPSATPRRASCGCCGQRRGSSRVAMQSLSFGRRAGWPGPPQPLPHQRSVPGSRLRSLVPLIPPR